MPQQPDAPIAVIGMAGRFPGARNLHDFWHNLSGGVESITFLPSQAAQEPDFVPATAYLDDIELFDAEFFSVTPHEATIMDPQHRVFLECAWEALESAGYNPETYPEAIGVYAGATINTYLLFHLAPNPAALHNLDPLQINIGNAGDFLTTRVSYKLNLKGPSHLVQSACSTSLVAVHIACQSLLNQECDMALAGGISINLGQRAGYRYTEGGMVSPDGHCRAFDAAAQGTIFGSGVGIVVLKRLADALADGDCIHAVIRGSAINNDGGWKVGYTAPSVDGQAQVITEALANAGVSSETIGYIEAHGTGTPLGDPIEIQALTKAFRARTEKNGFCAIGSLKTNIGHLDAAAGVAGLIKTILALKHRQLPPSLHFTTPNPNIDFARSPFYVNAALADWPQLAGPRRAGVSSFGVGGTNAHVVLEEAPLSMPTPAPRPWHLLVLSARSRPALEQLGARLRAHLRDHPDIALADVAYTLQIGRKAFGYRQVVVCREPGDALAALDQLGAQPAPLEVQAADDRSVVFMFPGQGSQHVNMAHELYQHEPTFRAHIDRCAELLRPHLGLDLRDVLYPNLARMEDGGSSRPSSILHPPSSTRPSMPSPHYSWSGTRWRNCGWSGASARRR
jgi:phthiocerol/phenolphthiocerol synthesis type-I polyketide synthase E